MADSKRAEKDAVTIGQIRRRIERQLEDQIDTLSKLIRQGYFQLPQAIEYLKGAIAETLTRLQNLDAMAGTEVIFSPGEGV